MLEVSSKYTILNKIGEGGFGSFFYIILKKITKLKNLKILKKLGFVYKAKEISMEKIVAIKFEVFNFFLWKLIYK